MPGSAPTSESVISASVRFGAAQQAASAETKRALTALAATVGLGAYTARKLPSVELLARSAELQTRRYGELPGERPVQAPRT